MTPRRLVKVASAVAVVLVLGTIGWMIRPGGRSDDRYYVPGVTPTREDCVMAKMKNYAKIDRLVLASIANECELTVQSIEGHEKLRKAWEERQAVREAAPKPAAPAAPTEQPEGDRVRRVWR
ncbi:MAG: hypothetical protein ACK4FK_16430 [Ferrovibrio sp.]|uniref:hypothetical protein n=1 Tax=Ferrovibrio sp. TaxID=1917215 RepID=UPI00391C289D